MMNALVFSMCLSSWYVAISDEHVCKIERDPESCTVRVECDSGRRIIPGNGTVVNIKEATSLSCPSLTKESIRRKSLSPDGELWAIIQCSRER